tara:strand:- start:64 stop:411 length:348 start_codon:yes stop_codon:yes gene_type:complete
MLSKSKNLTDLIERMQLKLVENINARIGKIEYQNKNNNSIESVLKEIHKQLKISNKIAVSKNKQLEISNKIASSKLIADTIGIDTIRTLKDKQIESIAPVAIKKIYSIHKNIYGN